MRLLCIYPQFPKTYWGAEYAMPLTGKRALLPPLGLLTIAALVPPSWEVRLADLNVRPLDPAELAWADVVFVSGMLIQAAGIREVAELARTRGKRVVVGGPYASTSPERVTPYADCVVVGEAERLIAGLCAALEAGETLPRRMEDSERPDVIALPPPRYDLLDVRAYHSMSLQWSRGCPFNCEFCDIIEVFGRKPRTKTVAQLRAELDAIYATGFRGSVFVVDDNFIGNKVEARRMLPELAAWMREHDDPFELFTEASVNLAGDDPLIDAMVQAGFTAVFLGIETPSPEALRETQKLQNTAVDLDAGVRKLVARGLEVMAGFILGFDADDDQAPERLRDWIAASPIPLAMVGNLIALPGTQLERRLAAEGRLLYESDGDNFGRSNFITRTDERVLLDGYTRLLEQLYSPRGYFDRAARTLELCQRERGRFRRPIGFGLLCLLRSVILQGLLGDYRLEYWRFFARVLLRSPRRFARAVALAINGEHMIRYTRQDVLPRLHAAMRAPARSRPRQRRLRVIASAPTG